MGKENRLDLPKSRRRAGFELKIIAIITLCHERFLEACELLPQKHRNAVIHS